MKPEKENPDPDEKVSRQDDFAEDQDGELNGEAPLGEVTLGKLRPFLEDTSLDIASLDDDSPETPDIPDQGPDPAPGHKPPAKDSKVVISMDEPSLDTDTVMAPQMHNPASILDLLSGKSSEAPEVFYKDDELDKQIEGKSLDEVLKISHRGEEGWHQSKKAEEEYAARALAAKRRIRKMLIFAPLAFLAAAVACVYILMPVFFPLPETDPLSRAPRKPRPVDPQKITIPPELKDEEELQRYLGIAQNFISEEKYDSAEIVLDKLLATEWQKNELLLLIAACREKQGNKEGAINVYKQILSDNYQGDAELPLKLTSMLRENGNYSDIVDILEPLAQRFTSNTQIQLALLEAYTKLDKKDKMISSLKRINRQFLSEEQLRVLATEYISENNTKEAFSTFLFLGQTFNDLNSLFEASKIAPSNEMAITVLNQLVGKSIGNPRRNLYSMLLAKALLDAGKKPDALRALSSVRVDDLNYSDSVEFLNLLCRFDDSSRLTDAAERILEKHFLENLKMQESVRDSLLNNKQDNIASKIFNDLLAKYPDNPYLTYVASSLASSHDAKTKLLDKALSIDPSFFEANLDMGKLSFDAEDWDNAAGSFARCIKSRPADLNARYWSTAVALRKSQNNAALDDFQKFLAKSGIPRQEQFIHLLPLAQSLPNDSTSMRLLSEMNEFPELRQHVEIQTVKTKLIYNKLTDSDFDSKISQATKQFRIIYLLGEGRLNDVMMLPTLKEEFPEFWKVFIAWRRNMSWEKNSLLLLDKHRDHPQYRISAELWLSQITPAEAEKQASIVPHQEKPLLYLMIAERYRRDGNKIRASVSYQTALKSSMPNIYKKVIEYFKDN